MTTALDAVWQASAPDRDDADVAAAVDREPHQGFGAGELHPCAACGAWLVRNPFNEPGDPRMCGGCG